MARAFANDADSGFEPAAKRASERAVDETKGVLDFAVRRRDVLSAFDDPIIVAWVRRPSLALPEQGQLFQVQLFSLSLGPTDADRHGEEKVGSRLVELRSASFREGLGGGIPRVCVEGKNVAAAGRSGKIGDSSRGRSGTAPGEDRGQLPGKIGDSSRGKIGDGKIGDSSRTRKPI